jgi:hypothetical protein
MPEPGMVPGAHLGVPMKKQVKKLVLAKETLRGLEKRDGLRQVAGGTLYQQQQQFGGTVETGCTACDPSEGSCCSCINSCAC